MNEKYLQIVNSTKQQKTYNSNSSFMASVKKTNLLVFVFIVIMTTNLMIYGQIADGFDPNVLNPSSSVSSVSIIRPQSDGKIIIAGRFTSVGGQPRSNIARLNADGTLDTTFANSNITFSIRSLAIQSDGKILVGTAGGSTQEQLLNQLVRIDANGTLDSSFNPNINKGIYSITLQSDGKIIIGGFFTSIGGQSRSNLARLNPDGTLDAGFTLTTNGTISTQISQPDGKILIGGVFSDVGGVARNRMARINADGTLDMSFNFSASYGGGRGIQDFALQPDGKIIIGGYPSTDGLVKTLARLNPDGTPDTAFNQNVFSFPNSFDNIQTVAVQANGKVLLGGSFINPKTSLFRLNSDGTTDIAFNPRPFTIYSPIRTVEDLLVQPDQKILVGGFFTRIGGANRNSFARLLSDSLSVPTGKFDFDGDSRADVSAYRPSNGTWYIYPYQSSSPISVPFGIASDLLAPADYDGDFISDIAVFRDGPSAYFYVLQSRTNTLRADQFGTSGDLPVPGDFDGDLKDDLAVYRGGATPGAQSYFYYQPTATVGVNFRQVAWGTTDDKPVVGDFDGDRKQDAAVYRPSNGVWYVSRSSDNQFQVTPFGIASDKLVPADYDGDFKTDYAVYRLGVWYILGSTQGFYAAQFGISSDIPVPADYDGDGKSDIAVFRGGFWYLLRSQQGFLGGLFNGTGDRPAPAAFVQ